MTRYSLTKVVCLGLALFLVAGHSFAKDKKSDDPRNQYAAIYPVKFFCKAVGADRDVIIMETNDPRFTQLRRYLSSIFKPYPKPDRWIEEETQIVGADRINYEADAEPQRRLESWYFVHGEFQNAKYDFVATEGEPQLDSAFDLLKQMWDDPTTKDLGAFRWSVLMDGAALGIYKGNLQGVANSLKPSQYIDFSGAAPWNWLYRALTKYEYYSRTDEKIDTVFCMKASGKPTKLGPLTIAPAAYIQQPFLSYRWGVFENAPMWSNKRGGSDQIDMLVGKSSVRGINKDGSHYVYWAGVRCEPVIDYQYVLDSLPFGAYTYRKEHGIDAENHLTDRPILALGIENTGQNSVPLGEVTWSLIIDGKAGPTNGELYDVPDQKKAVGIVDVAFKMKPGYTYQMYVDGPKLEELKRIDSFVVRIFDMPQLIAADGSVTKRGYVDITYKVDHGLQGIPVKFFPMQSPMVCTADYTATPMVMIPAMNHPVVTKPVLIGRKSK